MFSLGLPFRNCLGAIRRVCAMSHRKRMWRHMENVLNKNVKKVSPVGKKNRSKREKGE